MKSLRLEIEPEVGKQWYQYRATTLTLSSEISCAPTSLSGEIPDVGDKIPKMGATVRLIVDGTLVFYGRLFIASIDRWGVLNFTAYDLLRYLKSNFSQYYLRCEPGDVIRDVSKILDLPLGDIAVTGFKAKRQLFDNECAFDAIQKVIDLAIVNTKKIWVLFDDFGKLCLKSADQMTSDAIIGDRNLATEYTLTVDIDTDTYNYIALHRPMSENACRITAFEKDTETEKVWGRLMLSEEVDENMTTAQIKQKAKNLLTIKNRPTRSLEITSLGVVGLRAGMMAFIHFPNLPEISRRQLVLLDRVSHTFTDSDHTMSLNVHTFWQDSPK